MNASPLSVIDRLPSRSTFRAFTGSPCGIIGTLIVIATTTWMYIWAILAYSSGLYFQSSFQTQSTASQTFQVPYDLKMAVVFYNKTSNAVANHTALTSYFDPRIIAINSNGNPQYYEMITSCDPNYFADAINPVTLTSCYSFTPNKAFTYSYVNSVSSAYSNSIVGITFIYHCFNPFTCTTTGAEQILVQSNLVSLFTNYSATFYFSTRVLQPDGSTKHQVYYISTSEFNTPYTIGSAFDAEIVVNNITMDYSIMPWTNMVYTSNLAWYGLQKGSSKTNTAVYSPLPRYGTIASTYQNLIFRYYKKEDWLLGIIGGGMFLIFLSMWVLCHHFNQSYFRINATEELLLQTCPQQLDGQSPSTTLTTFKRPNISYSYFLLRFFPCYRNPAIQAMTSMLDITNIIKQIKIAERNLTRHLQGNFPKNYRRIKFDIDLPEEEIEEIPLLNQSVQTPERNNDENVLNSSNANMAVENSKDREDLRKQQQDQLSNNIVKDIGKDMYYFGMDQDQRPEEQEQKRNKSISKKQQIKVQQSNEEGEKVQEGEQPAHQLINEQKVVFEEEEAKQVELTNERQNLQTNAIMIDNAEVLQDPQQINEQESNLLKITPQSLQALKSSENTKNLFENFPAIMHLTNNIKTYNHLREGAKFDDAPSSPKKSKSETTIQNILSLFRMLDFYSVKIQFNAESASHSLIGVLFTFVIIALPCIQIANLLNLRGTAQVFVSYDFQQPSQINYKLTTGPSFQPAVCFSGTGGSYISSSMQLLFYTYSASQGYSYYNPVNLASGDYQTLGITPDSPYATIYTGYCYIFPIGTSIPMGGYNTTNEAYFGFRIAGACSGTASYCSSVQSATDASFLSFINNAQCTFTLYTPINQYSPSKNTVYTGQVYANPLREGTLSFSTNTSIEETLFLDQIQLLDSYSERFVGQAPPVIEETICTSRYQHGQITKTVAASPAFYEFRARPSGKITKVFLTGNTLDVIMGIIGGIFCICYAVFHYFGKIYNGYSVRTHLAKELYEQIAHKYSAAHKFCFLFSRLTLNLFCCKKCKYSSTRMSLLDNKIKQDLNALNMIKKVYSCSQLSTIPFASLEEKQLALIYFKENAYATQEVKQQQQPEFIESFIDPEESSSQLNIGNQISNEGCEKTMKKLTEQEVDVDEDALSSASSNSNDEIERQRKFQSLNEEYYEEFKDSSQCQLSEKSEILSYFDWFHSDAEFSFRGQWRIGSVFGFILSLLSIVIILCIFLYYIIIFANGSNYRISYDRYMLINPDITPPMQLDTSQNYRVAFGFYKKPSFNFQNVSNYLNATSAVAISVYQVVQIWQNGVLGITETKYDLVPCPADYFNGYLSPNDDPSYFTSITNGFCLPTNITLYLSSNIQNNSQYFKVSVYNKTVAGSTTLQTLTSTYPLGVYMTVPIVDLHNKRFASKVQQIRPNSQVLSKAYEVNLTLTRQRITFTTPNYTIGQNSTTLQTYNYLEDRSYERVNTYAATTVARVYSITFSHSGLTETYKVIYPSISQLFGYAGGITLIVIFVLGCIASSFNTYYKDYLIGKELYSFWIEKHKVMKREAYKEKLMKEEGGEIERENAVFIEDQSKQYLEIINNFGEFSVFKAWLLSFPAVITKSYGWNDTLSKVRMIQQKAKEDLDLFSFYKKLALVTDAINSMPQNRLSSNKNIPLTRIFDSRIFSQTHHYQYKAKGRFQKAVKFHQLSAKDQWILTKADQKQLNISNVFDYEYQSKILHLEVDPYVQLSERAPSVMQRQRQEEKIDITEYVLMPPQVNNIPPEEKNQPLIINDDETPESEVANDDETPESEVANNFEFIQSENNSINE